MPTGADRPPEAEDFLGDHPTRRLDDWRSLWERDLPFPIRSHRGFAGRLLVLWKRLLRPFVVLPQRDLWERQRVFNQILIDHVVARFEELDRRTRHLENFVRAGLDDVMRHDDALFGRVDRKLDRYRREADELTGVLRAALARSPESTAAVRTADSDAFYLDFEHRFRGVEEEIRRRMRVYLPRLEAASPVLDLGCGRGEALEALTAAGIDCRGVDTSAAMVRHCTERGLVAEQVDLLKGLERVEPGSLGAVVSFHVIEHLTPKAIERLVRLAFRALRPGGVLVLETPNPLSVAVVAGSFWLDPTHTRPVHPEMLRAFYESAGFKDIEQLDLRPHPAEELLPEIALREFDGPTRDLADEVNRLRDELDDLLHGCRDYGLIGVRPGTESP